MSVAGRLADVLPDATVHEDHGVVTADVPRERWVAAVNAVRDDEVLDGTFFDHLVVVDQLPGGFDVLVHLWSVTARTGVHLRTSCPRDDATVPSLAGVFAGAGWHERHAAEMFGVAFPGTPDDRRLLLPPGGAEHPLRKEHALTARVDERWPGAEDPAYHGEGGRPPRRRLRPPGSPG